MALDACAETIAQLARDASIELNVPDSKDLDASRAFLRPGKRVYISHLPKQRWDETLEACGKVSAAGFDPIPHIPVRLIENAPQLDRILEGSVRAGVAEVLLIAGDYPKGLGPYSQVADVLRADKLKQHGIMRVSLAGHPEGHPTVAQDEIRRAQLEKAALAAPLETTFVTQFFFEASPFLGWAADMRAQGIRQARLVAGLAGPAGMASLLKFAKRCGVGPSMRALAARPAAFGKLLGELGPEAVMHDLAVAYQHDASTFDGLHFFCFGGYLRTCEWLKKVVAGGN
ncbi:MAG TPA: methylenetetrahydrofolate reductase [Steroidobacteraceae bacterium]|nr:methylenetetrahydrofolate reductase [Steroidobacteraceae bacterium]